MSWNAMVSKSIFAVTMRIELRLGWQTATKNLLPSGVKCALVYTKNQLIARILLQNINKNCNLFCPTCNIGRFFRFTQVLSFKLWNWQLVVLYHLKIGKTHHILINADSKRRFDSWYLEWKRNNFAWTVFVHFVDFVSILSRVDVIPSILYLSYKFDLNNFKFTRFHKKVSGLVLFYFLFLS